MLWEIASAEAEQMTRRRVPAHVGHILQDEDVGKRAGRRTPSPRDPRRSVQPRAERLRTLYPEGSVLSDLRIADCGLRDDHRSPRS